MHRNISKNIYFCFGNFYLYDVNFEVKTSTRCTEIQKMGYYEKVQIEWKKNLKCGI